MSFSRFDLSDGVMMVVMVCKANVLTMKQAYRLVALLAMLLLLLPSVCLSASGTVKDYNRVINELKKIEKATQKIVLEVKKIEREIRKKNTEVKQTKSYLTQAKKKQQEYSKLLGEQLRNLQKLNRHPPLKRIIHPQNYSFYARYKGFFKHVRRSYINTHNTLQEWSSKQDKLFDSSQEVIAQLKRKKVTYQKKWKALSKQIADRKKQLRQIKKLLKQEVIKKQAEKQLTKKYQATLQKSQKSAFQREVGQFSGVRFRQLRGKMPWPTKGRYRRVVNNHFKNAWTVSHNKPQPVHVIADGKVVMVSWLPQLGTLIIIDHGEGFLSVYGNNSLSYVRLSENVVSNQVIGQSGNSGGREDIGLFFQLRHKRQPLNILRWMKKDQI